MIPLRRSLPVVALALGAALTLSACSAGTDAAAKPEATAAGSSAPVTVRVALTTGTSTLAIAQDEGFFADYGITLDISQLATGTETIAAVQGGSADIAYADTFAGANAVSNGFDLALVAGANHTSSDVSYLVKADSDIETVADLEGRSLGLGGVPFFRVYANEFLEHADVDPADVSFTVLKQVSALPEALESGSVDAIQSLGFQTAYSNDGANGYDFRLVGGTDTSEYQNPEAMQAGFWTTSSWGEENADVAQRFADAYREFASWYNDADVETRTGLALEYNDIDYAALAGDDAEKLEDLAFRSAAPLVDAPVDADATQAWLETSHEAAPEQVPTGVEFADVLLPSATTAGTR